MRCKVGYIRDGNSCIEDQHLIKTATKIIQNFEEYLQEIKGFYRLGETKSYHVGFKVLEDFIEDELTYARDSIHSAHEVKNKIVELLNKKDLEESIKHLDIHFMNVRDKDKSGVQGNVYINDGNRNEV
jgi:hypothetical protein